MRQPPIQVLLIEDNTVFAQYLTKVLLSKRHAAVVVHLHRVASLAEATDALYEAAFDVILADLTLPDASGLKTVNQLLQVAPDKPVVVLTGLDDEEMAVEAIRRGAQDYLVKTRVTRDDLLRVMRYAVERKRASAALRESEARNQAMLNAMPDWVLHVNREGVCLDCHTRNNHILGITREALVEQPLATALPAAFAETFLAHAAAVFATDRLHIFESQLLLDDEVRDLEARIVRSGTDDVLGIIRDITSRKKVERVKNEFISIVNHELRTPLTSISGSLGLIAGGAAGAIPPKAKQMIDIAHRNTNRLVRLINDMLDVQKIEAGKLALQKRLVALRPLMMQALAANKGFADQHQVLLDLEAGEAMGWVEGDADRLVQVLTNLISNAVKFSNTDERVRLVLTETATQACVSIADTGCGIDPKFQPRIFEKFAQADSGHSTRLGTGLGLSICKAIIEEHQGTITFDSVPKQGTTFYFYLPLAAQEVHQGDGARVPLPLDALAVPLPGTAQDKPVILHVEDDLDTAHIVASILQDIAQIIHAASLADAVRLLRAHTFDLVILDQGLPDGKGSALLPLIKEAPNTPIRVINYSIREPDTLVASASDASLIKTQTSNYHLRQVVEALLHEPA